MNGYWTAAILPEGASVIIGELLPNNAPAFFNRMTELIGVDVAAALIRSIPDAARADFYAGRAVIMVRGTGVLEVVSDHGMKKMCEKGKKGLPPPPAQE
jgi:hypothetical protein